LTVWELHAIIAGEGEVIMTDKYVLSGSLALRAEALGGHEIGRLKPEDIAGNITAATLLHQQALTSIWELHEAREDNSFLRQRVGNLLDENASLREIKARYELVEDRGFLEMVLSALLGFGISQVMSDPENPIGRIVLIVSGLAILCSVLPRWIRRKGASK